MKIQRRIKQNICSIFLFALAALFGFGSETTADHLTPERMVENKYTVVLLMIPEGEQVRLRFLFRDIQTGKNITSPIRIRLSIADESSLKILLANKEVETSNGIIDFPYKFPSGGLYKVELVFKKTNEEKIYQPDAWTLWVPGATKNFFQRYPIGLAEIGGFLLFFTAASIVVFSVCYKRAKGKHLEISFFGIFGGKNSQNRRTSALKRKRQKYSQ